MKMKRMMVMSLLYLISVSCTNQPTSISVTQTSILTNTVVPSATIPSQPTMTQMLIPAITPEITATPVPFNAASQRLIQMLAETYHRSASCLTDNEYTVPNNVTGSIRPEFIDITDEVGDPLEIVEIADNTKGTYRAYLNVCKTYWDCKYGLNQLHLEDRLNERTYVITWKGFEAITAHWNLIWIGEDIIAYMHILDPRREEIIAINVGTEEFAYVGQAWAYCVEP